ncbi:hypothetical protein ACOME3_004093 [Neoechinorhynchus agilis]
MLSDTHCKPDLSEYRIELYDALINGSFAKIYLGYDHSRQQTCAVQYCPPSTCDGLSPAFLKEVAALNVCANPYLVKLLDVYIIKEIPYMITEHPPLTLKDIIESSNAAENRLPNKVFIRNVMAQILKGLARIHGFGYAHCDLTPSNVLFYHDGRLKLSSFSLCRFAHMPAQSVHFVNHDSIKYQSPERLFACDQYRFEIDMWSVGCLLAELSEGVPLFKGTTVRDVIGEISRIIDISNRPSSWPIDLKSFDIDLLEEKKGKIVLKNRLTHCPSLALDLVYNLLHVDPYKRFTAFDALEHVYLANVSAVSPVPDWVRKRDKYNGTADSSAD